MTYEDIRQFLNTITPDCYVWHDGKNNHNGVLHNNISCLINNTTHDNSVLRITNMTPSEEPYKVCLSMHKNYQIKIDVQCDEKNISIYVPYAEIADYICRHAQYSEMSLTLSYENQSDQYNIYRQLVEQILQREYLEKGDIDHRFSIDNLSIGKNHIYLSIYDKKFGAYHGMNFARDFDSKFLGSTIVECSFFYDDSHNCGRFSLVIPLKKVNDVPLLKNYCHQPEINYKFSERQLQSITNKIKEMQDFPIKVISSSASYYTISNEIPVLHDVKAHRVKI